VLRDPRFWLVIPAAIAPGVILTGVFFHQAELVAAKGWDMTTWTALFTVFSACQILGSLGAGPLVDRVTARAVLPFFLLPMTAGLVLFAVGDMPGPWLAPAFLALQGITAGLSMTLGGALWAELYGVRHLGAIRATVTSFGILGTAASPVGMGALIDLGVGAPALAWLAVAYLGVSMVGVLLGLNLDAPEA
jgi:MFS family permease